MFWYECFCFFLRASDKLHNHHYSICSNHFTPLSSSSFSESSSTSQTRIPPLVLHFSILKGTDILVPTNLTISSILISTLYDITIVISYLELVFWTCTLSQSIPGRSHPSASLQYTQPLHIWSSLSPSVTFCLNLRNRWNWHLITVSLVSWVHLQATNILYLRGDGYLTSYIHRSFLSP